MIHKKYMIRLLDNTNLCKSRCTSTYAYERLYHGKHYFYIKNKNECFYFMKRLLIYLEEELRLSLQQNMLTLKTNIEVIRFIIVHMNHLIKRIHSVMLSLLHISEHNHVVQKPDAVQNVST